MVFDFNIPRNGGSSTSGLNAKVDTVISLKNCQGEVHGENDTLGIEAFTEFKDFYFTGSLNHAQRRYSANSLAVSALGCVGIYQYRGANAGVITVFSDGSINIWRNGFTFFQSFPVSTIAFPTNPLLHCSFSAYGSSVFLASGAGLYEFSFEGGGNVTFTDATTWIADYSVRLHQTTNSDTLQIGDVLVCAPPIGFESLGNSILYVRGIRSRPDGFGNMEVWVSGSELNRVQVDSRVTIPGKLFTGVLRPSGGELKIGTRASIRPLAEQTYGLPVVVADWFSQLMIATSNNYVGGSFPGVPENWNLALADGAFFAPILARTSLRPTQLLPFQEGLFVGMGNPQDSADGQLFLFNKNQFYNVLNDVGPLPNTMVSLLQSVYFLSGKGIHEVDITNVREQIGTTTVSGALGDYFEQDKPRAEEFAFGVFDKKTGQIWFGFGTNNGRQFLNMDPKLERGDRGVNRFSFYTGLPVLHATDSEETPVLWMADAVAPIEQGCIIQIANRGTQDFYRPGRVRAVKGVILTGPIKLGADGQNALMKDVSLTARNFGRGKIKISVLVDTVEKALRLGEIEIAGNTPNGGYVNNGYHVDGYVQGVEPRLFIADPYHQHRGLRFRILVEESGLNTPWELIQLSCRLLSAGYKRVR